MITVSNDELKAVAGVFAVLFGLAGGGGYSAGRMTAPEPPAPAPIEVRVPYIVEVPVTVAAPEPAKAGDDEPSTVPVVAPPAVVAPLPRIKATPPIVAKEKRERHQAKPKAKQRRKPTAGECAQLRLGLATIGRDGVIEKAKARRYSAADVNWAISACGL